jgi:hypothetical protein
LHELAKTHAEFDDPNRVSRAGLVPVMGLAQRAGLDVLRHEAMQALFGGLRAPSTLGSFLRSFSWGNVLQLGKVHRRWPFPADGRG